MLCFIYMSLAASLANEPFGLIFAIQLTIGRPGQGRAGTGAEYQGNSGSGSMRPFKPMGLPFRAGRSKGGILPPFSHES
jgi:hypothetical protein